MKFFGLQTRPRKRTRSRQGITKQLSFESLERRELLAIMWMNKGTTSNDSAGSTGCLQPVRQKEAKHRARAVAARPPEPLLLGRAD
jgi:hypothetical protein